MVNTKGRKILYDGKPVQVDSAIRDGTGLVINTTYATKDEVGGVQLLNTALTFSLVTDTADPFYDPAYPYRAALTDSTITSDTYATVTLSSEQATSGYYSPICRTDTGVLYLYANTDVCANQPNNVVTIPTINLGGGDTTTSTIDSTPTSGSGNAVSSNGVYTTCVRTTGTQDILASKTLKNNTSYSSGTLYTPQLNFASDNSGNIVGRIAGVRTGTTSAGIYLEVHNPNTNAWMNGLTVSTNGSNSWVTAPYRVYNASNTEDVVTIGHLNSAITMSGAKTIPDLKVSSNTLITGPLNNNYNGIRLGTWLDGSDVGAYLDLKANSDGSVALELTKANRTGTVPTSTISIAKTGSIAVSFGVVSGVPGVTVFHAYAAKVGRVVQVDALFNTGTTLTDRNVFQITSTSSVRPVLSIGVTASMYNQGSVSSGTHKTLWMYNGSDKYTQYLNLPSDIELPAGANWHIQFTYLTDE